MSGWRQQGVASGKVFPPARRSKGPYPEIQGRSAGPLRLSPSSGGAARSPARRAARRGVPPSTTEELGSGGSVPQKAPVLLIFERAGSHGRTTPPSTLATAHAGGGSRGDRLGEAQPLLLLYEVCETRNWGLPSSRPAGKWLAVGVAWTLWTAAAAGLVGTEEPRAPVSAGAVLCGPPWNRFFTRFRGSPAW